MPTETDENAKPSDAVESKGDFPGCGPGCGCEAPDAKGKSKLKIVVCLVVAVAVAGILLFKTTSARQNSPALTATPFSSEPGPAGRGSVLNSARQPGGRGASLSAIAELNTVAAKLDTVFVVIPAQDNNALPKEAGAALISVEETLNSKGLSTGVYTLKASSPDCRDLAAKVKAPGIAVLTKGRGIGFVSGSVSEASLLQAYVASTQGGGCCPPGSSANGKPCK